MLMPVTIVMPGVSMLVAIVFPYLPTGSPTSQSRIAKKKDADVQSLGRLLGPAKWQRECPTATEHAQAHEVPVRCLGLVFGWCVVDLVGWQDAKANSDKPTQPVPTDPTTPTKIPKKNKAKKDTGKK